MSAEEQTATDSTAGKKSPESAEPCPCGTGEPFDACCGPFIKGEREPRTAEQLMRSRYSAYARVEVGYIQDTISPQRKKDYEEQGIRDWAEKSQWHGLEIRSVEGGGPGDTEGTVEFLATYTEKERRKIHHEIASFKKVKGRWYFEDGRMAPVKQFVREEKKVGRNDPCTCGSGKKFKKCCGR